MTKTTALTNMDTVDAANDLLLAVDVSDTTMSSGGTSKKLKPEKLLEGVTAAIEGKANTSHTHLVANLSDATAAAKALLQSYSAGDFASLAHTHILSDVDELVDALASKYDSSHVGTTANKLVRLTSEAKLPAVDGSLLTNLPASASGGAAIKPLYFNRFENEVPNVGVIDGVASYSPSYAYRLIGDISADATTFAVTGGDTIADAGTGSWGAVLEDVTNNRFYPCMAVSRSGSNVTILPPAPVAMTGARLWHKHTGDLGQHLSEAGNKCLADMLYFAPANRFGYSNAIARLSSKESHWVDSSPGYWKVYGGATNNNLEQNYSDNFSAADWGYIEDTDCVLVTVSATGQGLSLTVPIGGVAGVFSLGLGHGHSDPTKTLLVEIFADGVSVGSEVCYGYFRRVYLPFPVCSELVARVTSTAGATSIGIRLNSTEIYENEPQRPFLYPGEKLLIVGDSWTVESAFPGLTSRLDALHDGTVTSVGVGGEDSSYPLDIVSGKTRLQTWIETYTPNVCLVHFYINDKEVPLTKAQWEANLRKICQICIDNGVQPVVILPGVTASFSQTQSLLTTYGGAFKATRRKEVINAAVLNDLQDSLSYVNAIGKFPGRMVTNQTDSLLYVANGPRKTDTWTSVFNSSTYVIPRSLVGANVTLAQLLRAYVGETQSGATLDDSGSANIAGTITNGTQAFDVYDLRRGYTSYTSSGYADLGSTPALSSTGAWTVAAWIWGNALTSYRPVFSQAVIDDGTWFGVRDGNPFAIIGAHGSHTRVDLQPSVTVPDDEWHHMAFRRSGAVWTFFLDGVSVASQTDADATRQVNQVGNLIGAWGFGAYNTSLSFFFDGRIADVIVDNIALSDADIAWLASDENFLI